MTRGAYIAFAVAAPLVICGAPRKRAARKHERQDEPEEETRIDRGAIMPAEIRERESFHRFAGMEGGGAGVFPLSVQMNPGQPVRNSGMI
jgi:hypothetical protein